MVIITTETQKKIIEAFLILASTSSNKKITVEMIGHEIGMSRENIYRNHFRGIKEIIERIHYLIDEEIFSKFQEFVDSGNSNITGFLAEQILPILYEKKEWLKVLYGTNTDPDWTFFLETKYVPLITNFLEKIEKKDVIPNFLLAQIIVKEFIALVSVWLTDNNPEPPELFIKKFLHIMSQSPKNMLEKK